MMGHWWMSPGSQPESPATGVSSVSVLARWHSHSLTVSLSASCTVQCTVTSSCPLSPDSDHSHALPDAWSLLRTAAMPGPGERSGQETCQLSGAGQSSWPLYCAVLYSSTDKCQAADTKPHMYLACRAMSCIHLIAKGILVMKNTRGCQVLIIFVAFLARG